MTNLDSLFKSRDITLPTKVHLVKAMVFPVVMYGCEGWTVKKAECRRMDALELWYWRRLLRVPWTARISNQSILKTSVLVVHWKDWCWSWNSNILATWCEDLTHWKRPWCWEGLGAGGEGDDREWDGWMTLPTRWTWVWVNSGSWWWTGRPGVLRFMGSQRVGHDWVTELTDWPTSVFSPGEFHGLYRPWGCKESDTTERLSLSLSFSFIGVYKWLYMKEICPGIFTVISHSIWNREFFSI